MRYRYRCKVKRKKDRWTEGVRDKEIDRYGVRESVCFAGCDKEKKKEIWMDI